MLTPPRPDTHTWTLAGCEAPLPSFPPGAAGRGSQRAPRPTAGCRLPRPHGGPHTPPGDPCPPLSAPPGRAAPAAPCPHRPARALRASWPGAAAARPAAAAAAARRPHGLCRRARPAISTGAVPAPPSAPPLRPAPPGTPPGDVVPAAPLPSARRRRAGGEGLQLPPCCVRRWGAGREPRSGCRGGLGRAPVPCGGGRRCGRHRPGVACAGLRRCGPCTGQGQPPGLLAAVFCSPCSRCHSWRGFGSRGFEERSRRRAGTCGGTEAVRDLAKKAARLLHLPPGLSLLSKMF